MAAGVWLTINKRRWMDPMLALTRKSQITEDVVKGLFQDNLYGIMMAVQGDAWNSWIQLVALDEDAQ